MDKYHLHILPNGLIFIHIIPNVENVFQIQLVIRAGTIHEDKKDLGYAHFLEHLMSFYNTPKEKSSIKTQKDINDLGITGNAWTGEHDCGYYLYGSSKYKKFMMDKIINNFNNPYIDPGIFEQEKEAVLMELDNIIHETWYELDDKLENLIYNTNPGLSVQKEKKNVRKATLKTVMRFRDKYYKPKYSTIAITSKENHVVLFKQVCNYFKQNEKNKPIYFIPIPKSLNNFEKNEIVYVKPKTEKDIYNIKFVFKLDFTVWDKQEPILQCVDNILTDGLDSRLYKSLRGDLGAIYSISSDYNLDTKYKDYSYYEISTETNEKNVKDVVDRILKEICVISEKVVKDNELDRYKLLLGIEYHKDKKEYTFEKYTDYYLDYINHNKKIETEEEIYKNDKKVNKNQIKEFCKKIFTKENTIILYCGNKKLL